MDPKNQKPTKKILSEKLKKKKKRKQRKHSAKPLSLKESNQSPDSDLNLEIEGINILEDLQNDSGHTTCSTPTSSLQSRRSQFVNDVESSPVRTKQKHLRYSSNSKEHVSISPKKNIRLVPIDQLNKTEFEQLTLDNITNSISALSLKKNSSKVSRTKGQKSSKGKKVEAHVFYASSTTQEMPRSQNIDIPRKSESMRWDDALSDSDAERERIRQYKINRRKRYLAVANSKGLRWVLNYGINGSPVSDSGIESLQESVITNFSTIHSLRTSCSQPVLPEVGCA